MLNDKEPENIAGSWVLELRQKAISRGGPLDNLDSS